MKRLLFFITFMTLATAALFKLLVTVSTAPPEETLGPAPAEANVLNLTGVTIVQREDARVRWELRADTATYDENSQLGRMQRVHFRMHDLPAPGAPGAPATPPAPTDGARATVVVGQSSRAFLRGHSNDLVLEGNVLVTRGPDLEIRSQRLEYDGRKQQIVSPGPVRVRTPQGVQEAAALRYSLIDERLEFTRPVFYQ